MLGQLVIAFGILGICLVIHIAGIVFAGDQLVRRRQKIEQKAGPLLVSVLLSVIFAFIMLLHMTEACLWAVYYYWRGFFESYETALYFSLKSYSTVGYGDVLLPQNWRLLGTIEAISGVLLCGLSAAFLFAIVNALFRFRIQQLSELRMPKVQATASAKRDGPETSAAEPHEETKVA
jgi:ion channel